MANFDLAQVSEHIRIESAFVDDLREEIGRVVVGQDYMVERLMIGLLASGHVLLEGVPGLAKTLTVSSLARSIGGQFQRIQFTPDLLPADLLGTLIYNQQTGDFSIKKGPLFANMVLADEVNRSPAKVQSALLESMQERQITIGETTFPLEEPFLVLATQNPIEQEGTYPLPEAQVDRFMLKIKVGYPSHEEEIEIMRRMARTNPDTEVKTIVQSEKILSARLVLNELYMDERVERYIVDLVIATRDPNSFDLPDLVPLIEYGASPRATINLNLAARAHAFLRHRAYVTPEDVRSIAMDVLRHRLAVTYEAEAEEMEAEVIIQKILDKIEVP
ncbi:MAG: AAA domain-containing protein [Rhodothermaceae bacterium]|nr:AAA domain-containing protein [Rhodothermaceae bacterium]MXZ58848.1 AAA domain-containing protein [Rhodothermaceae bacterium]MYB92146.1 AAA domain-containing protein [Rhodothermaceae bacterium]MYD67350.1 AAA domain-containing protein [Rhodothermaceae bacterium]MYG44691.1 AAA domain-containing protein [Rhodothermaceae bacterium]